MLSLKANNNRQKTTPTNQHFQAVLAKSALHILRPCKSNTFFLLPQESGVDIFIFTQQISLFEKKSVTLQAIMRAHVLIKTRALRTWNFQQVSISYFY